MATATGLASILRDEDVVLDAPIDTKDALLAVAAEHLNRTTGVSGEIVLKVLTDREKLGSTAINRGIAVPHGVVDDLAGPAAVLIRLAQPIEFGASDNNPVDLVFVLLWPSEKRSGLLATLGNLCRALRGNSLLQEVRGATNAAAVRLLLNQPAA